MTQAMTLSKCVLIGLGLLSLTACQHTDVGLPSAGESVVRSSVQLVRLPYAISAEEDATETLSAKTTGSVYGFLQSVNAGYGDVIMLDGPDASIERVSEVMALIRKTGLTFGGIAPLGPKPKEGTIMLYLERHRAIPPACGGWERETSSEQRNNQSAYFGCASATNLGLMVADPRDLVAGHNSGNSTGAAVGALYTPTPQATGPSVTMTLSGMEGVSSEATTSPTTSSGNKN